MPRFHFKSVFLIDDSEIDVLVNRRLIELTSFASTVTVTTTGEEAIKLLKEECSTPDSSPDWIFLDMHLPGMSGLDFIEEFKTLPEFILKKSKIIILSVYLKQEQLQKVFENKFVAGQLEKPLTQQALKNIVENNTKTISASF